MAIRRNWPASQAKRLARRRCAAFRGRCRDSQVLVSDEYPHLAAHTRCAMIALMPRTTTTFESGNKVGLKLTDETRELFLATIRQTDSAQHRGRALLRRRQDRARLAAEGSRRERGRAIQIIRRRRRARRGRVSRGRRAPASGQMAIGGVLNLPKYDKLNQLVRASGGDLIFRAALCGRSTRISDGLF